MMHRLFRRLALTAEERAYLKAYDRAEPVEAVGRPRVVVTVNPPQGTWASTPEAMDALKRNLARRVRD